ncbi:hypothetical protein DIPPA_18539 [Diplonema papillatum]|nr:hypothetical protein DIPPA_18539 [Diplonema papillatum]
MPPRSHLIERPRSAAQVRRDEYDVETTSSRRYQATPSGRPFDVPQPVVHHVSHGWLDLERTASSPGPQEHVVTARPSEIGGYIPRAKRFHGDEVAPSQPCSDVPGPDVYDVTSSYRDKRLHMRFRSSKRQPLLEHGCGPGPGSYNAKDLSTYRCPSAGFTRGGRDSGYVEVTPGPSDYQSPAKRKMRGPRWVRPAAGAAAPPAPADGGASYTIGALDATGLAPASATSFSRARRLPDSSSHQSPLPGPGAYFSASALAATSRRPRGVPFGSSKRSAAGPAGAGSDTYTKHGSPRQAARVYTFSKASRSCGGGRPEACGSPGPAEYDVLQADQVVRRRVKGGACFKTSRGLGRCSASASPGPTAYDPKEPSHGSAKGVSICLAGRTDISAGADNPGPGSYEVAAHELSAAGRGAPRWSASRAQRALYAAMQGAESPGPQGEAAAAGGVPAAAGGGITFPKGGRDTHHGSATPGPGAYTPGREFMQRSCPTALLYLTG